MTEPASLALRVARPDGQPAPDGWVRVRLDAPPPGMFVSTDFPVVEGTKLLEMRVPVINGKAEWWQVFPIRGEYRLAAEFESTAGSKTIKVFEFDVYESYWKWLVFGAFTSGLFFAGIIAGRIFSAPREEKRSQIGPVLLFVLICCGASGENASAGEAPAPSYGANLEIASATVGMPATIHWRLDPVGVVDKPAAKLTVTITQLEKNLSVFILENIPVAGEFAFDYQFTDGSDHRVTAIAKTDYGATVSQEQIVSVNAVPPPLPAKLKATLLFLAVIGAGLGLGRWSRGVSGGGEPNP
ncbi:MAG: hypothetical protein OEN50_07875 [Deltaproteobacteria bacterium]|nr:hypothetical protein [Deltaproteobacteria bacterium]